jgi:hypothetical protein
VTNLLALVRHEFGSTLAMLEPYGVNTVLVERLRERFLTAR